MQELLDLALLHARQMAVLGEAHECVPRLCLCVCVCVRVRVRV
jgi:hypothetical protein